MTDAQKEYHRKWREGHKKKGLCIFCSEPIVEGHTMCQKHLDAMRKRSEAKRIESQQTKKCKRCHQKQPAPSCLYCEECRASEKERMRQARLDKLMLGLCQCPNCENLHVPGKKCCQYHLDMMVKKNQMKRIQRKKDGMCIDCGALAIEGKKVCVDCWVKQCSRTNFGTTDRWQELKALFEIKPVCPYSGRRLTLGIDASLEHRIPKSRGGTDDLTNLEWVYFGPYLRYDVNRMKGHMLPEEYKEAIKEHYEAIYGLPA